MENFPLVSVAIITYNSAKYIVDALESVKNQTYDNIELIVTDDGSNDNTVQICKDWIESNKSRFVNTALITVEKNTGTSANCNRALCASKGEWLKLFAGDDELTPICIEKIVDLIKTNIDVKWGVGKAKEYRYTFDDSNEIDYHVKNYNENELLEESTEKQFNQMKYGDTFVFTPAVFYKTELLRSVGGWDEKYGVHEDFPMFFKLLKAGYRCYKLNEYLVKYRSSDSNVWGNPDILFNYKHMRSDFQIKKDLCFPYYSKREKIRTYTNFASLGVLYKFGMTKYTFLNKLSLVLIHLMFTVLTLDVRQMYSYLKILIKK